ncbi:MAG: transcriptional regulator [Candidatus Bathyarchaeia archaeon]|jgi:hypothetical protein
MGLSKIEYDLLKELNANLKVFNQQMDNLLRLKSELPRIIPTSGVLDTGTLLSLPDHLRKTAMTILQGRRMSADDVSKKSKRARALESAYLNQLVCMGFLRKERKGRIVSFFLKNEQA